MSVLKITLQGDELKEILLCKLKCIDLRLRMILLSRQINKNLQNFNLFRKSSQKVMKYKSQLLQLHLLRLMHYKRFPSQIFL